MNEDNYIDKDLEDIRYYRGSIKQFKDFWERKMKVDFNPHGTVEYKYPVDRKEEDKSLPYQDFTNGTSAVVKHNLKTRRSGIKEKQEKIMETTFIESFDDFNKNIKLEEELTNSDNNEKIKGMGESAREAREKADECKKKYEEFIKNNETDSANIEMLKYTKYKAEAAMLSAQVELSQKTKSTIAEGISYDEQEGPPESSFRSEDYRYKDDLRQTSFIIDELMSTITDGEQLDDEQSELISSIYNDIQRLKRSIQGREDLKSEVEMKRQEEQGFGH